MTTEGFWPGEAPAVEQKEDAEDQDSGWPAPRLQTKAPERKQADRKSAEVDETAQESVVVATQPEPEEEAEPEPESEPEPARADHVPGELDIPDGVAVLEGSPSGAERTVGVVVSRFNGEISDKLLESALGALDAAGVPQERITVMPVPGAFELPIGAMALAKTRRYSCVIALGCVIRGETAHFEYVAGEAASGLQLAGLETGVPVAFGVLTVDTAEQAEARVDKGADAARAALEMADLFAQVREQARSG